MENSPVLLYLHVPKAGGTTLSDLIYNHCCVEPYCTGAEGYLHAGVYYFPVGFFRDASEPLSETVLETLRRDDLKAVVGHFWFGIHQYLALPFRYVTLLRDPVDRAFSLYFHLKFDGTMSFEEFILHPPYREVDNGQTRRISGEDPEIGGCNDAMLDRARHNLREQFAMVGVTERFEQSAVLLKRVMGWSGEIEFYPRNRNLARPSTATLSDEARDLVRREHSLDVELYSDARELLLSAVAQLDSASIAEVDRLKAQTQHWIDLES